MEKPKFYIKAIHENSPSNCSNCGRYIYRVVYELVITGEDKPVYLGSECVKNYTGEDKTVVLMKSKAYNAYVSEQEDIIKQSRLKEQRIHKFEQVNEGLITWIENRIAQEQQIFDEAMKNVDGSSTWLPTYRGEFWESLLERIEVYGSLSEKQIEFVRNDMSLNRSISYQLGDKITVNGRVIGISSWISGYNGELDYVLRLKSVNGVDIKLPLNVKLRDSLGIKFCVQKDHNNITVDIVEAPEEVRLTGTVKWIDPAGGRIKLVRCKV